MSYDRPRPRRRPNPERLTLQTWNLVCAAHEQLLALQDQIITVRRKEVLAEARQQLVMERLIRGGDQAIVGGQVLVPYLLALDNAGTEAAEWRTVGHGLEAVYADVDRFWGHELKRRLDGRVIQAVALADGFELYNTFGAVEDLKVGSVRGLYYAVDIAQAMLFLGSGEGGVRVPLFVPGEPNERLAEIQIY